MMYCGMRDRITSTGKAGITVKVKRSGPLGTAYTGNRATTLIMVMCILVLATE